MTHSFSPLRRTIRNPSFVKRAVTVLSFGFIIPERIKNPLAATFFCRAVARSRIVSAVRLATTTGNDFLTRLTFVVDKRTFFSTPLLLKFSLATFKATGSLSNAHTDFAPNLASAMDRIPDPVPTSNATNSEPRKEAAIRSINSMQPRVVACVPVPKAMPGSIAIKFRWPSRGVIHGGLTKNCRPTRCGRKNRRQALFQFRSFRIRHRGSSTKDGRLTRCIPRRNRPTSLRTATESLPWGK